MSASEELGVGLGAAWFARGPAARVELACPIYHPLADRYLYLPMVGVAMIVGAVIGRIGHSVEPAEREQPLRPVALGVLGLLAFLSVERALVWQHALPLWEDTVARNPMSPAGYNGLDCAPSTMRILPRSSSLRSGMPVGSLSCRLLGGLAVSLEAIDRGRADVAEALRKAIALDPAIRPFAATGEGPAMGAGRCRQTARGNRTECWTRRLRQNQEAWSMASVFGNSCQIMPS